MARACQTLAVPNSWIDLEPITGEPEVLWFDPFDSFAQVGKAFADWGPIYATHAELGRLQAQISAALTSQRTVIAVRREDLSYRANRIDLSKARFMRVLEVRLHPGRENDFAEAFKKLSAAYEKTESDLPWVVYQVNLGMASPTFFIFVPMKALGQNDDLLKRRESLQAAEGEAAGAASSPTQKISYITGKWQIMNLLGRYKDKQGDNFRLGQFHDDLIKNGSLPISVVEWILLDDPSSLQKAVK